MTFNLSKFERKLWPIRRSPLQTRSIVRQVQSSFGIGYCNSAFLAKQLNVFPRKQSQRPKKQKQKDAIKTNCRCALNLATSWLHPWSIVLKRSVAVPWHLVVQGGYLGPQFGLSLRRLKEKKKSEKMCRWKLRQSFVSSKDIQIRLAGESASTLAIGLFSH